VSFFVLLVVMSLASAVMLWGLSVFFQGFLYNTRADRLPLRAAAGGLALGLFLSLWTFANVKADFPNKYGTLLEFQTVGETPVQQFKAVRYYPNAKEEQAVTYGRLPPGRPVTFGEVKPDGTPDETKPYRLNDSQYLTTAIVLQEKDKPEGRFETELTETKAGKTYKDPDKIFREKGSTRFLHGENPDKVSAPSRGSMFGAIALNLLNFVVWYLILWLALRYSVLHSVGLAFVAGIATMVVLMPLLFQKFAR
jgi:hypothetical protein